MRRVSSIALPAVALLIGSLLTACDTGDGTTLQVPVAPTTTVPIDTTPLPSLPLTDEVLPGDDVAGDTLSTSDFDETEFAEPFSVIAPWLDGGPVDPRHTCDGAGDAPGIAWTGVPDGTVEIALSLVDEANMVDGRPFAHWVVAGIDPAAGRLVSTDLPPGAFEAFNSSGEVGYASLCPDPGTTGVYVLRLFAVGQQVEAGFGAPAADVLDVLDAVSFDVATLSGTVTR